MATQVQDVTQNQPAPLPAKPINSFKPVLETIAIIIFFSWLGVLLAILSTYR